MAIIPILLEGQETSSREHLLLLCRILLQLFSVLQLKLHLLHLFYVYIYLWLLMLLWYMKSCRKQSLFHCCLLSIMAIGIFNTKRVLFNIDSFIVILVRKEYKHSTNQVVLLAPFTLEYNFSHSNLHGTRFQHMDFEIMKVMKPKK